MDEILSSRGAYMLSLGKETSGKEVEDSHEKRGTKDVTEKEGSVTEKKDADNDEIDSKELEVEGNREMVEQITVLTALTPLEPSTSNTISSISPPQSSCCSSCSSSSSSSSGSDSESSETCDDTDNDPTYDVAEVNNSSSSDEEERTVPQACQEGSLNGKEATVSPFKNGKIRKRNEANWKKSVAKRLRNSGKPYQKNSKSNSMANPRQLKEPCSNKCKLKCYTKISEEDRKLLFSAYWNLGDIEKQRQFILSSMETIHPKYRYVRENSRRRKNNAFYFNIKNNRIRVCKLFFKNTLDINDRPIRTVISKKDEFASNILETDKRGRHGHHSKIDEAIRNDVRNFINNIPKVESHYRRADSSKYYIDGSKDIAELHRDYLEECKKKNISSCNYVYFYRIFTQEFNLASFKPKKDQCETCVSYENAPTDEKEKMKDMYDHHLIEKDLARQEKNSDKEKYKNNSNVNLAVYDLEAVFQCPKGDVSVFFYKSKLNVFNFTIYDLKTLNADCFIWHEGIGHRGVNEIGTCVLNYLESKIRQNEENLEFIFYSDNCAGQHKNKYMISLYMFAVKNMNIKSITHKYLIKGHTQNEGDSVHSVIEKEVRKQLKSGPMYVPDSFICAVKRAKKKGDPYNVHELSFDDFYDLKQLNAKMGVNILNNTQNEQVKLMDIKVLKVEKASPDRIFYKTSYNQEFKEIIIRKSKRLSDLTLSKNEIPKAFVKEPGISEPKRKDLLQLIEHNYIPKYYKKFYTNL